METVKIKFTYFTKEIGWLGMMADSAKLLWNDFFSQAVDEKINRTFDPKNKEEVLREIRSPMIESMKYEDKNFEETTSFSFEFPVERLKSLEQAADRLDLERNEFIQTAILEKVDEAEDQIWERNVREAEKEDEKAVDCEELEKELNAIKNKMARISPALEKRLLEKTKFLKKGWRLFQRKMGEGV